MTTIIVNNNTSYFTPSLIFISIFFFIMIYLQITAKVERNHRKKIRKAKKLIEEGHKNALKGKKDDGLYNETKKLREEKHQSWEDMLMEGVKIEE